MSPRSLLEALLALLFPDCCAGCRKVGALLCAACRAALRPYPGGLRNQPASLAAVQIVYLFDGPLRAAVHQLKYRRVRRMARPLGELLAADLAARPLPFAAVAAVPLHATRLAERGFNQAEELAAEVARAWGCTLIGAGLARTRATGQQARLDARGRAENVRGAFVWVGKRPPPRQVLLVDDVLTTGATMGACADALRDAGAEEVYGLALARSRPDY
ncbi:MAG TPA: ComF family protein [Roseiflexaceae bacterium]|nr:ComF family protein [Roseiflexaceae bacterium]